jgi:uncharacterized repeat protein (TIGR01451 family)
MKRLFNRIVFFLVFVSWWIIPIHSSLAQSDRLKSQAIAPVQSPVLKWSRGGCFDTFCPEANYSSPAVADLDKDGKMEVIGATSRVTVLNGTTGSMKWQVPAGHDRSEPNAAYVGGTWSDVVVADLEGDGAPEIITSHSDGSLSVYNANGYFKAGWPKEVTPGYELRSLGVADLDKNGIMEIMTASTRVYNQWYVFEPDGSIRPSNWPQHNPSSPENGETAGCFNQNIAAGDIDGDKFDEIVAPNDMYTVAAFKDDGSQIRTNAKFGLLPDGNLKYWTQVPFNIDETADIRGYTLCQTEHRASFGFASPVIVDVNNDGKLESVFVGDIVVCGTPQPYKFLYKIPYIMNGDRTRWKADSFDWTVLPNPGTGAAPLSTDYNYIDTVHPNVTPVDLDGDGRLEILYPSYDGRMHAYWLDGTEHSNWPFSVIRPADNYISYATESVVADINGDGHPEVIFASWPQKDSHQNGKLFVVSYLGDLLWEISLPAPVGTDTWNGSLATPTLANIDDDSDLEIVINTAHSGLVAYDLPGSAQARVLWPTGHGNYQRSGSVLRGNLNQSTMTVDHHRPVPGDIIAYTVILKNPGPTLKSVTLRDKLPDGLGTYGTPTASSGQVSVTGNQINWTGDVAPGTPVSIIFKSRVDDEIKQTLDIITNVATVVADGNTVSLSSTIIVNGIPLYIPVIDKP